MCATLFVFIMCNIYVITVWKCENSFVEIMNHYARKKRVNNTKEQGYVGHEKYAKNSSTQNSSASLMFHLHTRMQNQVLEPMG